jgi:chorismate-pyruvate lyase
MSAIDPHAADLLYPLSAFDPDDGSVLSSATILEAEELPQPYRMLLAHDRDMTGTLETYFNQSMTLRVFGKKGDGDSLFRQVVLEGVEDGVPREFGAIRIDLSCFTGETRDIVSACKVPLGRVLREHGVPYVSNPSAYLCVTPDAVLGEALHADTGPLYGRKNELKMPDGRSIAKIIEILPKLAHHKDDISTHA